MNRRIGALSAILMLALTVGCDRGAPRDPALEETAEPPSSESATETREPAKALEKAGEELEKSSRPEQDAGSSMPDGP